MPLFTDGQQISAAAVEAAFTDITATGQKVLDELTVANTDTLLRFEHGLAALNNRRRRADLVLTPDIPCRFRATDFLAIDQTRTSAQVRIDGQSVTLREKSTPSDLVVRNRHFSTSTGTIEQFNQMYRVHVSDGSKPTGTFDIELDTVSDLTALIFSIVSIPSDPGISVSASPDGITYTPAASVAQAGYRINAWFTGFRARFIRLQVSPTHADTIGGTTFTFGLTGISASIIQYYLASDLHFDPVSFSPVTQTLRFVGDADPGLSYYLSFDGSSGKHLSSGDVVAVPGVSTISAALKINTSGILCTGTTTLVPYVVPSDFYTSSLVVTIIHPVTGNTVRVPTVPQFSPGTVTPAPTGKYVGSHGTVFEFGPVTGPVDYSTTIFNVSYLRGPAQVSATLHVILSSHDPSSTPVFTGAALENIF